MVKRIISVMMCVMLIVSVTSMAAFAYTGKFDIPEYADRVAHVFPGDELSVNGKTAKSLIPRMSNGNSGVFNFYSNLTSDEKFVYDCIVAQKGGLLNNNDDSATSFSIPVTSEESRFYITSQEALDTLVNSMYNALEGAISAIIEDYPEYFWIGGYGASCNIPYDSNHNAYHVEIVVSLNISTGSYANVGVVRNYYQGLMEAVDNFRIAGANRYQKLKSIHDQIAKMVAYDTDFNNPIAHQPTSVFFEPYEPVCEGYAEAVKLLCDKAGIPCIGVVGDASGEAHKWNYIQMEDGKWYGFDLTWDDQGDILYDFFLAGADTKNAFFGQDGFLDGHTPTGEEFQNASYTLSYPTLSSTSYSLCIPNINASVSFDAVNNRLYFGKGDTLKDQFFATAGYSSPAQISGQTVTVSGTTTGATVTVKNGSLTKVYTVSRFGDVDANGSSNTTDYNKMKAVVAGTGTITENSANYAAGDFDGDGTIDAFDLYYMDMYLNDNIDF